MTFSVLQNVMHTLPYRVCKDLGILQKRETAWLLRTLALPCSCHVCLSDT